MSKYKLARISSLFLDAENVNTTSSWLAGAIPKQISQSLIDFKWFLASSF